MSSAPSTAKHPSIQIVSVGAVTRFTPAGNLPVQWGPAKPKCSPWVAAVRGLIDPKISHQPLKNEKRWYLLILGTVSTNGSLLISSHADDFRQSACAWAMDVSCSSG